MIVISDTSPILYLLLINQLELLPQASQGLINFPQAIAQLQQTNFRASPELIGRLLTRYQ